MNLITVNQLNSLKQLLRLAERGPWLASGSDVLSTGKGKVIAKAIDNETARFIAAVNPHDFEKLISNTISISSLLEEVISSLEGELSGNDKAALALAKNALQDIHSRLNS